MQILALIRAVPVSVNIQGVPEKVNIYSAVPQQKDLVTLAPLCLFQLYHLHNGRLHKLEVKRSIQVACIESQSIVVEDKQNYYHPLSVSVKAHLACYSNSCFVCKWYSWKRLTGAISLRSFCRGTAVLSIYFMYVHVTMIY